MKRHSTIRTVQQRLNSNGTETIQFPVIIKLLLITIKYKFI